MFVAMTMLSAVGDLRHTAARSKWTLVEGIPVKRQTMRLYSTVLLVLSYSECYEWQCSPYILLHSGLVAETSPVHVRRTGSLLTMCTVVVVRNGTVGVRTTDGEHRFTFLSVDH